jgi:hypothetical protein
MAYIYFPIAFIYLLPAVIFFWLSKDIVIIIMKKLQPKMNVFFTQTKRFIILRKEQIIIFIKKSAAVMKRVIKKLLSYILKICSKTKRGITKLITSKTEKKEKKKKSEIIAGCKKYIKATVGKIKSIKVKSKTDVKGETGVKDKIVKTKEVKSKTEKVSVTEQVKSQFDELDMITINAIAIMLSDTKMKAASPYIANLRKPDIKTVLLKFCQDTYFINDMDQLNKKLNKSYYKWKITRYLRKTTVFVKRGIGDTMSKKDAIRKARVTKNRYISRICETIINYESVKYIFALSKNDEISDSKRNYKLDHLSENYKDAMIYLVDILLTCTCISKMLFVERMIKRMDDNSEFKKIITNMANSIDDYNIIISKSRPVYKQYYQSELGYINGDDYLYGMAVTIMVNSIKRAENMDNKMLKINTGYKTAGDFKQDMQKWLDELSKSDFVSDIGMLILQKTTLSIKDNYDLLINAMQQLTDWEYYYNERVAYYRKERDKERYLKGDFD